MLVLEERLVAEVVLVVDGKLLLLEIVEVLVLLVLEGKLLWRLWW